MNHTETFNAVLSLCPGACFSMLEQEDGSNIITWDDNNLTEQPSEAAIAAEHARISSAEYLLVQKKTALAVLIRGDANRIIGEVIGNLGNEYKDAYDGATAYKAAGYTGAVPASVQSWADAKIPAKTAQWAADDILATAVNWKGAQDQIRAHRLRCAELAKAATSQAALDAIAAEWAGFVVSIRASLGI
jgi:hypothetical protein